MNVAHNVPPPRRPDEIESIVHARHMAKGTAQLLAKRIEDVWAQAGHRVEATVIPCVYGLHGEIRDYTVRALLDGYGMPRK